MRVRPSASAIHEQGSTPILSNMLMSRNGRFHTYSVNLLNYQCVPFQNLMVYTQMSKVYIYVTLVGHFKFASKLLSFNSRLASITCRQIQMLLKVALYYYQHPSQYS